MSGITVRAKSVIKLKSGDINLTWEFQKGTELTQVIREMIRVYLVNGDVQGIHDILETL